MTFYLNELDEIQAFLILGFLFCYILITVQQFVEKWITDKHKVSPYKLLFFKRLFGAIINTISFIPIYYIGCLDNFNICFDREKKL